MIGRGEHSEIVSFVGKTVDSELSGNSIDVCPVGALTSQAVPLRRAHVGARAPQVGVAARFARQQPHRAGEGRPRDARAAARERSHQRVLDLGQGPLFVRRPQFAADRLTHADGQAGRRMEGGRLADGARIRRAGTDRHRRPSTAPARSVRSCRRMRRWRNWRSPGGSCAASAATTSTSGCARAISAATATRRACRGSACRSPTSASSTACSSSAASCARTIRWSRNGCGRPRKKGTQVSMLHSVDDDWLLKVAHKAIVAPSKLPPRSRASRVAAQARASRYPRLADIAPTEEEKAIAASLLSGKKTAVLLGNYAVQHRTPRRLHALAQALSPSDRRDARLSHRSGEHGRRASRRCAAAVRRHEACRRCSPIRAGPTCCCTRSPNSTSPMRSRRAPRSRRPISSS